MEGGGGEETRTLGPRTCAVLTKEPAKTSRAHSMQCSMRFGKFLSVHIGIWSSGGSCESEYASVACGSTTCVFAFVPSVPDSSSGFEYHTARPSTYVRALTLSSALVMTSSPDQKAS